jgi:MFS superfamily sulfate permease-like transporter
VGAVILTDLLQGVFLGILVAVFFILKTNFGKAAVLVNDGSGYLLKLTKDVSFLNKSTLRNMFHTIPPNASLLIDGSQSKFIDQDIQETIGDFMEFAKSKNITVELKNITLIS